MYVIQCNLERIWLSKFISKPKKGIFCVTVKNDKLSITYVS